MEDMSSLLIRKADSDDTKQIMDLIKLAIIDMENKLIYQWDSQYPNIDTIKNDIKSQSLYVIYRSGSIIAIITIDENEEELYKDINWFKDIRKSLIIHRLVVFPELQGQGHGSKLMEYAEEYAKNNSYESIKLDAFSGNERAIRFYRNKGYLKKGEDYFPRRNLPFYFYEKKLI